MQIMNSSECNEGSYIFYRYGRDWPEDQPFHDWSLRPNKAQPRVEFVHPGQPLPSSSTKPKVVIHVEDEDRADEICSSLRLEFAADWPLKFDSVRQADLDASHQDLYAAGLMETEEEFAAKPKDSSLLVKVHGIAVKMVTARSDREQSVEHNQAIDSAATECTTDKQIQCHDEPTCVEEARAEGLEPKDVAKQRGERYIKYSPYPGDNKLAKACKCHSSVMRKAIAASEALQRAKAEHALRKTGAMRLTDVDHSSPEWQMVVDEALQKLIECSTEKDRESLNTPGTREHLANMEPADLSNLVEAVEEEAKRRR